MNSKKFIVTISILIGIIILVVAVLLVRSYSGHNWSQGVSPQESSESIDTIALAVRSAQPDSVIDTDVENTNTSGTPFGNEVTVRVLVDKERASEAEIQQIREKTIQAIKSTGVKNTYNLYIQYNVQSYITSGEGSAEMPLTDASQVNPGGEVDEKIVVE